MCGIYIHIPFCEEKCRYCSFVSLPRASWDEAFICRYIEAMRQEILLENIDTTPVDTLYIGGGTPSLLTPDQIYSLIESIMKKFHMVPGCEITVELNPGTVDYNKLHAFAQSGVTRVSIGAQSLDDENLKVLGRIHTAREFLQTFEMTRSVGFSSVSVDLMLGIPGQTMHMWQDELEKTLALSPSHISVYSLAIEQGTPLFYDVSQGKIVIPDDDAQAKMIEVTHELLTRRGYGRYEISNYALFNHECLHNKRYWQCEDYRGFGASAWSYRNRWRYKNVDDPHTYVERIETGEVPIIYAERLSIDKQMEEFMIMGLRMAEGVSSERFLNRFGRDIKEVYGHIIGDLTNNQSVEIKTDGGEYQICIPVKFWNVHSEIAQNFVV